MKQFTDDNTTGSTGAFLTGVFAGAQGILTVNSLIGISPHTLSLMHCLHLVDPDRRYRLGGS